MCWDLIEKEQVVPWSDRQQIEIRRPGLLRFECTIVQLTGVPLKTTFIPPETMDSSYLITSPWAPQWDPSF